MSIGLGNVHVRENARIHTEQNFYTSNVSFPLDHLLAAALVNSPRSWTRSGIGPRLRAPSRRSFPKIQKGHHIPHGAILDGFPPPHKKTRDQNVKGLIMKDKEVKESYENLRNICAAVKMSMGQEHTCLENIEQEVEIQEIRFTITSQKLIEAVKSAPLNESPDHIILYTQLINQLKVISEVLKDVPSYLTNILSNFQKAESSKLSLERQGLAEYHPDQEFKDVLDNVGLYLDSFDSQAKSFIKQPPITETPEELKRLYSEGLAATTLFQCLSRACPVHSHRSHTVYLGLSTDDTYDHETRIAIQSRSGSGSQVWLRVDSTVDALVLPKETTSTRKRKVSSDTPMSPSPPPKTRKTHHIEASNYQQDEELAMTRHPLRHTMNQIQVCPEYLKQDEDSSLVMRILGASNEWHSIYFLESEQRPSHGDVPLNMASLFSNKQQSHYYDLSWRVRVARLVSEAVLRIQCHQSPCYWGEKDVVFYAVDAPYDNLKPFLKVEIERQENEAASNNITPRRPGRWLLKLGFILLQLGLSQNLNAPPDELDEDGYRNHMLRRVNLAKERDSSLDKYLTVVRSCVEFDFEGEDEQGFRKMYYQLIIFPLKMMEQDLEPREYMDDLDG